MLKLVFLRDKPHTEISLRCSWKHSASNEFKKNGLHIKTESFLNLVLSINVPFCFFFFSRSMISNLNDYKMVLVSFTIGSWGIWIYHRLVNVCAVYVRELMLNCHTILWIAVWSGPKRNHIWLHYISLCRNVVSKWSVTSHITSSITPIIIYLHSRSILWGRCNVNA